jgi:hypothetical protein
MFPAIRQALLRKQHVCVRVRVCVRAVELGTVRFTD